MPSTTASALLSLIVLSLPHVPAVASQTTAKPKQAVGAAKQNTKPKRTPRADAEPEEFDARRVHAASMLTSLAERARGFKDDALRARVQAQVADALWETDAIEARMIFRRAWEAAEAAAREAERRADEARKRADADTRRALPDTPDIRQEVLRLVARRDEKLGDEMLASFTLAREQAEADAEARARTERASDEARGDSGDRLSPAVLARLRLAHAILDEGDAARALRVAEPALAAVRRETIRFLGELRAKDRIAGDRRFEIMLADAARDPRADANTVLLLSSYCFTPRLFVSVDPRGGISSSSFGGDAVAPVLSDELRSKFLRIVASVLLRASPAADGDGTSSGRVGTHFAIARLLPLFERHAPDFVLPLRQHLAALEAAGNIPERFRNGREPSLSAGLAAPEQVPDPGEDLAEQLARARTPAERDRLNTNLALELAARGPARARGYADAIDDGDLRSRVRAYTDFLAIERAINRKDADEAVSLLADSTITAPQRAWALVRAAQTVTERDATRAAELLDRAAAEARRITADADRARALIAVAYARLKLDASATWDTLAEATKAANAAGDFAGVDANLAVEIKTKNSISMRSTSVSEFDLPPLFSELAKIDFARAAALADELRPDAARSFAALAVARVGLAKPQRIGRYKDSLPLAHE